MAPKGNNRRQILHSDKTRCQQTCSSFIRCLPTRPSRSPLSLPSRIYLAYGPFASFSSFQRWLEIQSSKSGLYFYCVIDTRNNQPVGFFSFARIFPDNASIELAHVYFSPKLKRTRVATDAVYHMIDYAFELGNRRCEWKCHSLNKASCDAAVRFGFSYEGVFRNSNVVKGRNRDTAWFSIRKEEWPHIKPCYKNWLAESNFDENGKQKSKLSELIHGEPITKLDV